MLLLLPLLPLTIDAVLLVVLFLARIQVPNEHVILDEQQHDRSHNAGHEAEQDYVHDVHRVCWGGLNRNYGEQELG